VSSVPRCVSANPERLRDNGLAAFRQGFEDDESTDGEGGGTQALDTVRMPGPSAVQPQTISLPIDQHDRPQHFEPGTTMCPNAIDSAIPGRDVEAEPRQVMPSLAAQANATLMPQLISLPSVISSTGSANRLGAEGSDVLVLVGAGVSAGKKGKKKADPKATSTFPTATIRASRTKRSTSGKA
jgi:hypothetical protein